MDTLLKILRRFTIIRLSCSLKDLRIPCDADSGLETMVGGVRVDGVANAEVCPETLAVRPAVLAEERELVLVLAQLRLPRKIDPLQQLLKALGAQM